MALNAHKNPDVVWPENKQIGLIDSIFRNFFIPPVIFAVHNDGGEETRVCVDGKQVSNWIDSVRRVKRTRIEAF